MFSGGQPELTIILDKDRESIEDRISIAIGELKVLQLCIKRGQPVRDKAVSANAQMKRVQEGLGILIKKETP